MLTQKDCDRLFSERTALQAELTTLRSLAREGAELMAALHPMNPDEPCIYYDWWLRVQRWREGGDG